MGYIEGEDRKQRVLFPEVLEDYIGEENPVRFIDVFIEGLDLSEMGFGRAIAKETGRPPYDPGDLLRLYVYGYLNRTRSSRQLEREAGRNVELMWLMRKLRPDFKTIADFRKDNPQALKKVCREFTLWCKRLELFGGELVAIDGSKFGAVNSPKRNFTEKKLRRMIREIEDKIDQYLKDLDRQDKQEAGRQSLSREQLKEKIEGYKGRRAQYEELKSDLEHSGESQISLTDPESRSMRVGHGVEVSYNVQIVVDQKNKLLVEHEVTNEVIDLGQLSTMAKKAKEMLGVEALEVVADRGYYNGEEVKACEQSGITAYVPKSNTSSNLKRGLFTKEDFIYEPDKDCYRCPAGKELSYRYQSLEQGRQMRTYQISGCKSCGLKSQCSINKKGIRAIKRWVDEAILEAMARRIAENPEKIELRKNLAEHPFGTIKRAMNQGYFLMRGLTKVGTEMSLTILAYNLKRVINILGVRTMVEAVP
jgi:transposase/transcription elongation factor Elf1